MLVDITQNDWILEKILIYFPSSSLFKFRLINHTWNRVALQLLNSRFNRNKYAIKLSIDNIHEYLDQVQLLLLQLSQNEQCVNINPYPNLCLLPTELRINLCSSSANSNESNNEERNGNDGWSDNHFNCNSQMVYETIHSSILRLLRIHPSRLDDKLQHSILMLLRIDLLARELVQHLKQQDKSEFSVYLLQQLEQDYHEFKSRRQFGSGYRPPSTYQDSLISVFLFLGSQQNSMIRPRYLEIPLQSRQLLDQLCQLHFQNLKTLICVVNDSYRLLIMKFGCFLKNNCPFLQSLELHFCNTGFNSGMQEDTRTLSNEMYPVLPKLAHFGLVLPKTANASYGQQILNIIELSSLKYVNLTSVHLDFNVCLRLVEVFPRDSSTGLRDFPPRRGSSLRYRFRPIRFPSVKILKFTLPASIIIKSETEFDVMKQVAKGILGWLFYGVETLLLEVQEPNPITMTTRIQNLLPVVGHIYKRHNRLDEFVSLLMESVRNAIRIEIHNYYQNWICKASLKRYDLKLTIPTCYKDKNLKLYSAGTGNNNWSELCMESILRKFPDLRRLELSTELLYKSNPNHDSLENALRKFKECVVADESQVEIQLL